MAQQSLWYDTVYDALRADIDAAGGNKAVAKALWPTVDVVTGANKLANATNPNQAQKLDPAEVLAIKRLALDSGSTATINFESQQFGFRIEWLDPLDEQQELDREIRDLLKVVMRKQEQRERAESRTKVRK